MELPFQMLNGISFNKNHIATLHKSHFRMNQPESQGNMNSEKLKEQDQPMKRITTFPKLITFLVKYQWLNKGGNPKWEAMAHKLRLELQNNPENIMYNIDVVNHQVKCHMPLADNKRAVLILKIPRAIKFICSAEHPVRFAPSVLDVERLRNCRGAMNEYYSNDDILNEFEIEETNQVVKKWLKKKWCGPSNQEAVILLDNSSNTEASARATRIVVKKLRRPQISLSPERSLTPPTPPTIRRQASKADNYDLFGDDSITDDSVESFLL